MKLLATTGSFLSALWRLLRRNFLLALRKDYVKSQLAARKGVCGRHGCCDLAWHHRLLNVRLRKCLDTNDRTRCLKWGRLPPDCRIYPLDEQDKIPETRDYCNFHWDKP
jgi:hypothetical protein